MKRIKSFFGLLILTAAISLTFAMASNAANTQAVIGDTEYASIKDALREVENGQTIVLKKNATFEETLKISRPDRKFAIDLNGYTLTFKDDACLFIDKGGVVLENGTLRQENVSSCILRVSSAADCTITDGIYEGRIFNHGTMQVDGGSFRQKDGSVFLYSDGSLFINGGEFKTDGVMIQAAGPATITGGTFTTALRGKAMLTTLGEDSSGEITVAGGTFIGPNAYGVQGNVRIKGGDFSQTLSLEKASESEASTEPKEGEVSESEEESKAENSPKAFSEDVTDTGDKSGKDKTEETAAEQTGSDSLSGSEIAELSSVATYAGNTGSGSCGNSVTWTLDSAGTLTISGSGAMDDFTREESPWYSYRSSIVSVVINKGVTSIGNYAFYECRSLKSVTISQSVTKIGNYAFYYCSALTEITIPDGVKSIGDYAFCTCEALKSISLPQSLNSIGDAAFYCCSALTGITIPNGVTDIGDYAFYTCSALTSITIPDGVTDIGKYAFANCEKLKTITIPKNVTSIKKSAFYNCSSLADVYYGGTKSNWGTITIASGNELLTGASIHYETKAPVDISLCTITLSSSSYTYDGSAKKPTVTVKYEGSTLKKDTDYTLSYSNNTDAGSATAKVTGKGDYTGSASKTFTIKQKSISSMTLKLGTTTYYYDGKAKKPSASISGLKSGTDYTVSYSSNTNIGTATAAATGKGNYTGTLKKTFKIKVKKNAAYTVGDFKVKITNTATDGTGTVSITAPAKTKITTATIPASVKIGGVKFKVTKIAKKAFYQCPKLEKVTLGKNVTEIGKKAFYNCPKLSSVTLRKSVTTIGNKAFCKCGKLKSITLKSGVTSIGRRAFYGCSSLKKIKINSTKLKTIGDDAFKGIKSDAKIIVPKSKLTKYKKLLSGKGQGSKVKITSA